MVVWVEHKNTVHFWFFGVSRYRYKTPINIYSLHAFRTEKDEGEILLPMLPCWQLASGGIMRWLCILYRLFTSFVFSFSVPCGKLRRPTNFHNIYWFWDAKTTSGYQQYVNVAHGGFSLPTWQEQTRICQQNRQNKTITQNRQNCVGLWDLYAVRFQRCDVESCSTLVLALVGSVLKFLELEFSVVDQTQTFPNLRIFVASGHRTAVHVSVKRGTYWLLG